ncbi:MAG: hypothetical protein MZV63_23215 [Marinilabiliales bacterium]|nr:hypothetical protein [Marinilabiliales bacterium]
MTNLNMSLDFDLGQLLEGKEKGSQQTSGGMGQPGDRQDSRSHWVRMAPVRREICHLRKVISMSTAM